MVGFELHAGGEGSSRRGVDRTTAGRTAGAVDDCCGWGVSAVAKRAVELEVVNWVVGCGVDLGGSRWLMRGEEKDGVGALGSGIEERQGAGGVRMLTRHCFESLG